jgi:hypothetical protein
MSAGFVWAMLGIAFGRFVMMPILSTWWKGIDWDEINRRQNERINERDRKRREKRENHKTILPRHWFDDAPSHTPKKVEVKGWQYPSEEKPPRQWF